MRGSAEATQEHCSRPIARLEIIIVSNPLISADEPIDENDPLAALRLLERFPAGTVARGVAALRYSAREREVLQERDEVVLSARRARRDWQVRVPTL